tara:strand:+ start:622 stop:1317 length:696 start_codon:yes stop_codon:yes gene_type:complete
MTFLSTFKKAVATAGDVLTTKGDILSRSSSALGRLGVGSNGKVLTATSGDALGISWETVTVADNSITLAKMASGTDGNLITYDSSGDPAYVVTGSATNVLTSNGAGQAPTFQSAGGGTQTQISFDNSTFTMSASQTVETIPATGESDTGFIMVNTGVGSASDDAVFVSSDSGTTYTKSFTQTSSGSDFNSAGMKVTIDGIGNSTGRYKVVTVSDSGTRKFIKCITTIKEEA